MKGKKGMDIISHKWNMCYLVWKNSILEPGSWGCWLSIQRWIHASRYTFFEHKAPWVEVSGFKQRVEAQYKTINKMDKKCK